MAATTPTRHQTAQETMTRETMMPMPKSTRYRVMTTKKGEKIRLAFLKGGAVAEAKNLRTGATHTPAEFARDRKNQSLRHMMVARST